jgi:hypothetical protein
MTKWGGAALALVLVSTGAAAADTPAGTSAPDPVAVAFGAREQIGQSSLSPDGTQRSLRRRATGERS